MHSIASQSDRNHIIGIAETAIPAPPKSRWPGEHLFVNCHYDMRRVTLPRRELAELAQKDALRILRVIAGRADISSFPSVTITIYGNFLVHGVARPVRRRLYRVNLLCKDLPAESSQITPQFLKDVGAVESDELDDVPEMVWDAFPRTQITGSEDRDWDEKHCETVVSETYQSLASDDQLYIEPVAWMVS